jgi:hypothetical protein
MTVTRFLLEFLNFFLSMDDRSLDTSGVSSQNESYVIPWEIATFGHLQELVKQADLLKELQDATLKSEESTKVLKDERTSLEMIYIEP